MADRAVPLRGRVGLVVSCPAEAADVPVGVAVESGSHVLAEDTVTCRAGDGAAGPDLSGRPRALAGLLLPPPPPGVAGPPLQLPSTVNAPASAHGTSTVEQPTPTIGVAADPADEPVAQLAAAMVVAAAAGLALHRREHAGTTPATASR
ncbi:MAG TPA: hypothetical protein VNQ77_09365 [Frankiaceae bacterium]|nr:hypothetical protein [Frankiaceae bacterium]